METFEKHYRTLVTKSKPEYIREEESVGDTNEYFKNRFRYSKIICENSKSWGPGGIRVELFKYGGDRLRGRAGNVIGRVVRCSKTPGNGRYL